MLFISSRLFFLAYVLTSFLNGQLEAVSPERPPTPGTPEFGREPEERISQPAEKDKEKEDSDSSGSSTASFVYKDHCYSLPPKEGLREATASSLHEDHGYNRAQIALAEKAARVKDKLKNANVKAPKVLNVPLFVFVAYGTVLIWRVAWTSSRLLNESDQ